MDKHAKIMSDYARELKDDRDRARERLWRGGKLDRHPGPSCFCDDCCEAREHNDPTCEEYESYKRAFPHLDMRRAPECRENSGRRSQAGQRVSDRRK